jgi:hypothetical protein
MKIIMLNHTLFNLQIKKGMSKKIKQKKAPRLPTTRHSMGRF